MDRITELELSQSYIFNIIYREGNEGFAGTLNLTPEKITFKVFTERSCNLSWSTTEAKCHDFRNNFILTGLRCTNSRSSSISHTPSVGFYEIEFTVENVIFFPGPAPKKESFLSLHIHSDTVSKWIGQTTTQDQILKAHHGSLDIQPFLIEFIAQANDYEAVGVQYNATHSYSLLGYEQSFKFPPSFFYTLEIEESKQNLLATFLKINNLLSFLTGMEPIVKSVILKYDAQGFTKHASLYFLNNSLKPRHSDEFIMFPLGKDSKFENWGLPPFPLSSFERYFSYNSDLSDTISKYVKYRSMTNIEDRFLGYFRLLEKLCHIRKNYLSSEIFAEISKSTKILLRAKGLERKEVINFEKGFKRFNSSKYNTQKCLTEFFNSLPLEIQKGLKLPSESIESVCKLRNDITHANAYDATEDKIYTYAAFIHHLLIFAILQKLGINLVEFTKLTNRLRNY